MDPVGRWLERVSGRSRQVYASAFEGFRRYVGLLAEELVARQRVAPADARFELLDRLEAYVNGLHGTRKYKMFVYSAVPSFFLHNRCELPRDRFNIQNSKPPTAPCMNLDHVKRIVLAADLRGRSMILCAFMRFMGIKEIEYVNLHCFKQIKEQVNHEIIRIDLPGRKRNTQPYRFIAGDALEALREYLARRTDDLQYVWVDTDSLEPGDFADY